MTFRPASQLPLIALGEKAKVLGVQAAPAAPAQWQEARPLFWREAKPISLYMAIIDEFKITSVFDVTSGSGALMEACLTRGVQHHGLCFNRDHMSWLQAVADRTACGLISVEGPTLHSEELAKAVREHFKDILQMLMLAPAAQDAEEVLEPDSEGERRPQLPLAAVLFQHPEGYSW